MKGLEDFLKNLKRGYAEGHDMIAKASRLRGKDVGDYVVNHLDLGAEVSNALRENYPRMFLDDSQIERLAEILVHNEDFIGYLSVKEGGLSEQDDNAYADYIANKIYAALSDEDRLSFIASDIRGAMFSEHIMNLGLIELRRRPMPDGLPDYIRQNADFFSDNKEMAARLLVQHYMKQGEMMYNGKLDELLGQVEKDLKNNGAHEL